MTAMTLLKYDDVNILVFFKKSYVVPHLGKGLTGLEFMTGDPSPFQAIQCQKKRRLVRVNMRIFFCS